MTAPTHAVHADARTDDLAELLRRPGPFASLSTELQGPGENAPEQRALHWRQHRQQFEKKGIDTPALDAIEGVFDETPDGRLGLVVITRDGHAELVARHFEEPRAAFARVSPVPSLAQVIEWRQLTPSHVVVLTDRTGADIFVATPEGTGAEFHEEGEHDEIHKPNAGGWSQRRFQQRAEDSWEHNAADVAAKVATLADAAHARTVIVAGDSHARSLLKDALPDAVAGITHVLDHGSREAGLDSIGDDVMHLVATAAAERTVELLERWKEQHGRGEAACEGPGRTAGALAAGQVETLLIHDDPEDDRTAFFGPDPHHVGLTDKIVQEMGVDEPEEGRLADVLIRAAILTGASVRIVPAHGGPDDSIGALLRWA